MRQVLLEFTVGGISAELRAYSTFYALAWLMGPLVAAWVASRRGLGPGRALAVYVPALAAGIMGARVLDLFVAWGFYADDPSRIWGLSFRGFSLYGGLVVATAGAILLARSLRLPVWRLADCAVPGLVVGIVLMRTGCFLNGCCFGTITDVPWGVVFPSGSPAWAYQLSSGAGGVLGTLLGHVKPVHPTQLYEMAAALVLGAGSWWLTRRHTPDGVPFLSFALGFTVFRAANGLLRQRLDIITAPVWFYPAFYLVLAVVLTALIVRRVTSKR